MSPASFDPDIIEITPAAPIDRQRHGWRAKCLQRLVRMGLPVPRSFAVPVATVRRIAAGASPDPAALAQLLAGGEGLVAVRPSAVDPDWGGPGTMLNVGMTAPRHAALLEERGRAIADAAFLSFLRTYAVQVDRLDPDAFAEEGTEALAAGLSAYRRETDESFPDDPARQLAEVMRSMARAWDGPSARLLRQARGAPADAPLGLVVQDMALALGPGLAGTGWIEGVDGVTGEARTHGRFHRQIQGEAHGEAAAALALHSAPGVAALEDEAPALLAELTAAAAAARARLREEMRLEFVITDGAQLRIIDAIRTPRTSRAAVRIAVALAREGIIAPSDAVMRIQPRTLAELLHRQVDPGSARDVILHGIPASPGAAAGQIVFTAARAQDSAARGEACILVRRETVPEDVRGMHAAQAVLTERGGITSHAAVIARGLGRPAIVGAVGLHLDLRARTMTAGGRTFREGDLITVDGSSGQVLAGRADLLEPAVDPDFAQLLDWADAACAIGVRANADTPEDARTALAFGAQGIGLCRTEHMFFEEGRLPVMREMIFAGRESDRRLALDRLRPMQRDDFAQLFAIMAGKPVCIRLFDPPLHEFLPQDRDGLRELALSLDLPLSDVTRRVEAITEANPMLGMRGVRLGIALPEIYEMQARAIFEATLDAARASGAPVVPEIMLPLVSAEREVEIVKTRIDAVAAAVRNERRASFDYRLGVMVETPRAALRAGDIAEHTAFLSFGTNDLTQMTYGLSRDDAGRFMGIYLQQGVWPEDPFHILDAVGVGELVLLGAERARERRPGITLSVCGEHGGNPESIAFCLRAGLDYVSCSPFRVPVARLAAARESIRANDGWQDDQLA